MTKSVKLRYVGHDLFSVVALGRGGYSTVDCVSREKAVARLEYWQGYFHVSK